MPRWLKIGLVATVVTAALLLGAMTVLVRLVDPAPYVRQAADRLREATGRELKIGGRAELRVLPSLSLVLEDVSFANASWGSRPDMARVKRLEGRVALLPLLRNEVAITRLVLIEPDVLLETDRKGVGNWVFKPPAGRAGTPVEGETRTAAIDVHDIAIDRGRVVWRRAGPAGAQTLEIAKLRLERDALGRKADVDLAAAVNGQAFTLQGNLGPLRGVLDRAASWPVDLAFAASGARLALYGTIDWRTAFPTFDGTAKGELTDTAAVARLAGKPVNVPVPLSLEARAHATQGEFTVAPLKASIGKSVVEGKATVRTAGERPYVNLDLRAAALDLAAVGLSRAEASPRGASPGDARFFSADPLPLELLRSFDADAAVAIERLITPGKLPIEALAARAALKGGKLEVRPASARIGGGAVTARLSVDAARAQGSTLAIQIDGRGIELQPLAAAMGYGHSVQGGRLEIAVNLAGPGASMRRFAAGATGEVRVVATGPVRLSGSALDLGGDVLTKIADTVNPFRRTERTSEVRCAVAVLPIRDGIATVQRTIAVETNRVNAVAAGTIDLRTEALDLAIRPQVVEGLGIGAASLADVVRITGTLADPAIGIDTLASARAALSVGSESPPAGSRSSVRCSSAARPPTSPRARPPSPAGNGRAPATRRHRKGKEGETKAVSSTRCGGCSGEPLAIAASRPWGLFRVRALVCSVSLGDELQPTREDDAMNARTANGYEIQLSRALGAVRGVSRGAWLAGLGAVSRVQSTAPRYFASLVREGERFEGRAKKTAGELIATVKSSPGYAAVHRATRPYVGRLQRAYGETASVVRARIGAIAAKQDPASKRASKRIAKGARARMKRAA